MGDQFSSIEFLDPREDPGGVAWLDAEDEQDVRSSESSLPPRASARRVLGSLLVFAFALCTTGFAGVLAYRHDQAVEAAADALILREVRVGDPVTLVDPGALGGSGAWRIDPSATVAVDVTNESPDTITLLPGATLLGPGLTAPATLRPSGLSVLRRGQSGRLTGVATVNCAVQTAQTEQAAHGNTVLVPARTASGAVGVASVALDGGGESVRQEICVQQGQGLAASVFPESVNTRTHSFTLTVSAHSLSTQPLRYRLVLAFSGRPTPLPGTPLSAAVPVGAVSGTLAAGADLSAGYTMRVLSCPTWLPTSGAEVDLEMEVYFRGKPAVFQSDSFGLDTIVGAACGLLP